MGLKNDALPFDKKAVRRALAEAIDMRFLVDAVFQDAGEPKAAMISPPMWGHNDEAQPCPYDPTHAKKLLEEAGCKDGFKTHLMGGQPFSATATGK